MMFVAESPGPEEVKQGKVLIGPSGQCLSYWIRKVGIACGVYLTNVSKCPAKGNTLGVTADKCFPWLLREIHIYKPKVVVALGAVSASALLGSQVKITEQRGKVFDLGSFKLVLTIHPAYILRNWEETPLFVRDLQIAWEVYQGKEIEVREPEVRIIRDPGKLLRVLQDLPEVVSLDVETTGFDWTRDKLVSCAVAVSSDVVYAFPWDIVDVETFRDALCRRKLVMHNASFDTNFLYANGVDVLDQVYYDTMVAAHLLEENVSASLTTAGSLFCDVQMDLSYEAQFKKGIRWKDLKDSDELLTYNAKDAVLTFRVYEATQRRLQEQGLNSLFDFQMYLVRTLTRVERRGVLIDVARLEELDRQVALQLDALKQRMFDIAGHEFNVNSPAQLSKILYEHLKLPVLNRTPTGNPSTNVATLEKLAPQSEFVRLLLDYRKLVKVKSTFLGGSEGDKGLKRYIATDGRVHTSFNIAGTVTGRLSSSRPNLQQIPERGPVNVREIFVAPEGWKLIVADFDRAELYCAAYYARDALLHSNLRQEDFHRYTASRIFRKPMEEVTDDERFAAKTITFGILYGRGPSSIAEQLDISTSEARQLLYKFFDTYKDLAVWTRRIKEIVRSFGQLRNIFGRRRRFWGTQFALPAVRAAIERQALNFLPQSTASDMCCAAAVDIDIEFRRRGMRSGIVLLVHDSIVVESPEEEVEEAAAIVKSCMEKPRKGLQIPVHVEVGRRWA